MDSGGMDSMAVGWTMDSRLKSNAKPFVWYFEIKQLPKRLAAVGDRYDFPRFYLDEGVPMFVQIARSKAPGNGGDGGGREMFGAALCNASSKVGLKVDFSITLTNNSRPSKSVKKQVTQICPLKSGGGKWGWPSFIAYADLLDPNSGFLKDGHQLTLVVKGIAFMDDDDEVEQSMVLALSDDLGEMFDRETLSDVVVKVKGGANGGTKKEFKVHKMVLAARSKYFAAIFSQPKKSSGQVLEVEDVDSGAMEALLRFLYTGKVPALQDDEGDNGEKLLLELLFAADKFGIPGLKSFIERRLSSTLSVKNVCERLIHADRLKAASLLKARCIEFVRLHHGPVTLSAGWRQLIPAENADLMGTLFRWDETKTAVFDGGDSPDGGGDEEDGGELWMDSEGEEEQTTSAVKQEQPPSPSTTATTSSAPGTKRRRQQ